MYLSFYWTAKNKYVLQRILDNIHINLWRTCLICSDTPMSDTFRNLPGRKSYEYQMKKKSTVKSTEQW